MNLLVTQPSLDRVLGYEANFAGTSFLTLDKWKSGNFKFGSDKVNIVGDKTQVGSLGAVGYDDEGVVKKNGISLKMAHWLITRPSVIRRILSA
jgi:predicted Zn-dependent protease